jgi:hypothetical protein
MHEDEGHEADRIPPAEEERIGDRRQKLQSTLFLRHIQERFAFLVIRSRTRVLANLCLGFLASKMAGQKRRLLTHQHDQVPGSCSG